jgi:hypothetical protein
MSNYDLPSFVRDMDRYSDKDDTWEYFKNDFACAFRRS